MTPERDVELKACPFCGGEATPAMAMNMQGTRYYHQCNNCNMQGPDSATREGRDAVWNTRAALSQGRATTAEGDYAAVLDRLRKEAASFHFAAGTVNAPDDDPTRLHVLAFSGLLSDAASALATLQAERDAAVAQERERCARIADEVANRPFRRSDPMRWEESTAEEIAKLIRAAAPKGDAKPATEER